MLVESCYIRRYWKVGYNGSYFFSWWSTRGLDLSLPADWAQYVFYHTWPASMSEYRFDIRANSSVATRFLLDDVFIDAATLDNCLPDADTVTTGWTTTPLFSKVNDASDATVIQATAA